MSLARARPCSWSGLCWTCSRTAAQGIRSHSGPGSDRIRPPRSHDWLEARLSIDYPALVDPAQPDGSMTSSIKALLGGGLVLPILDGLDEIPNTVRGPAIARINDAVLPGEHLVVTCRTAPFREAVRPVGGVEVTLQGAAGIELRPLAPASGGLSSCRRWRPHRCFPVGSGPGRSAD